MSKGSPAAAIAELKRELWKEQDSFQALEEKYDMMMANYAGALADLDELVRVARDNPRGLNEFLKLNYPKQMGLSEEEHSKLVNGG